MNFKFIKLNSWLSILAFVFAGVSSIWLTILGEWKIVLVGIGSFFLSSYIIPVLLFPLTLINSFSKDESNSEGYFSLYYLNLWYLITAIALYYMASSLVIQLNSVNSIPFLLGAWSLFRGFWAPSEINETTLLYFRSSLFYLIFIGSSFIGNEAMLFSLALYIVQFIVSPVRVKKLSPINRNAI
ncbi:hypothetical protein [Marinifilum fragile]|uniref:hypothetical protein n=1 Tax=Marinifilum fragile TaxID=570161 RepID=UPI002AA6E58F|nr:hypothetical protein [Marinifilum fragile]